MKCKKCGFENEDSNIFCNNCGFILEKETAQDKKESVADLSELEDLLNIAEKKFEEENKKLESDTKPNETNLNISSNEDKEDFMFKTDNEAQNEDTSIESNNNTVENIQNFDKKKSKNNKTTNKFIQYEENTWGRTIKTIGILFIIAGFIGSIILGNTFGIETGYYYKSYEFNWVLFVFGVLFSFIPGIVICGFGELININHKTMLYLQNIEREIMKNDEMH